MIMRQRSTHLQRIRSFVPTIFWFLVLGIVWHYQTKNAHAFLHPPSGSRSSTHQCTKRQPQQRPRPRSSSSIPWGTATMDESGPSRKLLFALSSSSSLSLSSSSMLFAQKQSKSTSDDDHNNNKINCNNENDDDDDFILDDDDVVVVDDDDDDYFFGEVDIPSGGDESDVPLSPDDLKILTIHQLKQQLRLRGLKVSGRKQELIDRLVQNTGGGGSSMFQVVVVEEDEEILTKAKKFAKDNHKEFVDVSDYLDESEKGKEVKSSYISSNHDDDDDDEEVNPASKEPEVWGSDARIVDDLEGRQIVVDSLSRMVVEFTGSNQTDVQAWVVASRDALKPYLAGGKNGQYLNKKNETNIEEDSTQSNNNNVELSAEERLKQIQLRREKEATRPVRFEDESGIDEGDETGIYSGILNRDFSDWGKYTQTGAQLSASEVAGLLLLPDVYGAFTEDTKALAEKIAFECQPVVVMVPDLFAGQPWEGPTDGTNALGQTYEEWRDSVHSDLRVSITIRAAAACLRERYGVSAVTVFGTCYGGGRALEAAAGWLPDNNNVHDVDGSIGPPLVNPSAAIAWYPTRYNAKDLFGPDRKVFSPTATTETSKVAVMGVFAGKDVIPGATKEDAAELKALLEADERVKDHLIKVFSDQDHGFAHRGMSQAMNEGMDDEATRFMEDEFGGAGRLAVFDGDAEVACLLSTAFMETYSRVFLPTIGPPISKDEKEVEWSQKLDMKDLRQYSNRDVRKELDDAVDNFVEEPLQSGPRIDPTDESQEEELIKLLRSMESPEQKGQFKIEDDDDLATIYAKLTAADDDFQIF